MFTPPPPAHQTELATTVISFNIVIFHIAIGHSMDVIVLLDKRVEQD